MEWITIQVGNKEFCVSKQALSKSPYFDKLISKWEPNKTKLQIDGDPRIFRHFLNSCIYEEYYIPPKYYHNVQSLISCYGLDNGKNSKPTEIPERSIELWESTPICGNGPDCKVEFEGKFHKLYLLYDSEICGSKIDMNIKFNDKFLFRAWFTLSFLYFHETKHEYGYIEFKNECVPNIDQIEGKFCICISSKSDPPKNLRIIVLKHTNKTLVSC